MSQQKSERSRDREQHRKQVAFSSASADKRTRAEPQEQASVAGASSRQHLDVEAEKRAARASGKQVQRGQGRRTNPKTNQSNQYR